MPNRLTTWSAGQTLTAAALNGEFDNLLTGDISRTSGHWGTNDDVPLYFGSSRDAQFEWSTNQAHDALMLGLSGSNTFIICEKGDIDTSFGIANQTDPTLVIHSADGTVPEDYIAFSHNQTDGILDIGSGGLRIQTAGTDRIVLDDQGRITTPLTLLSDGGAPEDYITLSHNQTNGVIAVGAGVLTVVQGAATLTFPSATGTLMLKDSTLEKSGNHMSFTCDSPGSVGGKLEFYHNSATPAGNDVLTSLDFYGKDSAGNKTLYATLRPTAFQVTSNQEQGGFVFSSAVNGKLVKRMELGESVSDGMNGMLRLYDTAATLGVTVNLTPQQSMVYLSERNLGSGQPGPSIGIGRNSNGSQPAAGFFVLTARNGWEYFLWVDQSGNLRINNSPPTYSADTAGTIVGTQG